MERGGWWAAVHGVTEPDKTEKLILSHFRLNKLSSFQLFSLEFAIPLLIQIHALARKKSH